LAGSAEIYYREFYESQLELFKKNWQLKNSLYICSYKWFGRVAYKILLLRFNSHF
jgi:hypothetical protein